TKGGDGEGEILRRFHAVAQSSGVVLKDRESHESLNRYRKRRQHLRDPLDSQHNPRAYATTVASALPLFFKGECASMWFNDLDVKKDMANVLSSIGGWIWKNERQPPNPLC